MGLRCCGVNKMKVPGIKNDERYKALVCQRCGEVYFRKLDPEENRYEGKPVDWGFAPMVGDICPKCAKDFHDCLKLFMSRKDEAQNGD